MAWIVAAAAAGGCGSSAATTADAGGIRPEGDAATVAAGCDGARMRPVPADPAARGPWAVGARTVTVGRLTAEVWYPAADGSADGAPAKVYDIREHLPASQRDRIPDGDNPWQRCDCADGLPIDEAHGPYPAVVFVHGTASFRTQSLSTMTHWASRGFVVIAADHPGLQLSDTLAFVCPDAASGDRDLAGDVDALVSALRAPAGDLAFLAGHVAADRLALAGHSAGGSAVAGLSDRPGVRAVMPWSAGAAVTGGTDLEAALFVSGMSDAIARFDGVVTAYDQSASPKWLVGIAGAGHLVVTDLCELRNDAGEDMMVVAQRYDICGAGLAGGLFDCDPAYVDPAIGGAITRYATAAVLERALQCADRDAALAALRERYAEVGDYRSQ